MPLFLSSLKAAHPVNAPIAPFHVAIQRIVLLLDEAVDAAIERMSNVACMPAVAVIQAAGLANGGYPVREPLSVAGASLVPSS